MSEDSYEKFQEWGTSDMSPDSPHNGSFYNTTSDTCVGRNQANYIQSTDSIKVPNTYATHYELTIYSEWMSPRTHSGQGAVGRELSSSQEAIEHETHSTLPNQHVLGSTTSQSSSVGGEDRLLFPHLVSDETSTYAMQKIKSSYIPNQNRRHRYRDLPSLYFLIRRIVIRELTLRVRPRTGILIHEPILKACPRRRDFLHILHRPCHPTSAPTTKTDSPLQMRDNTKDTLKIRLYHPNCLTKPVTYVTGSSKRRQTVGATKRLTGHSIKAPGIRLAWENSFIVERWDVRRRKVLLGMTTTCAT
ncbi:hypothetical protein BCR34DRAFT_593610 [Clohesyomyces aquaticus]|uniref:Uncharacterized protein n=1 Tax=Clohesyomyces aquaticus TaxID=1231657 RepID=A0A1Y1YHK2_9PLEO|nr:hypothetical protein BCR34DRAFT_593610 [Clohesyomyces aquaticus]